MNKYMKIIYRYLFTGLFPQDCFHRIVPHSLDSNIENSTIKTQKSKAQKSKLVKILRFQTVGYYPEVRSIVSKKKANCLVELKHSSEGNTITVKHANVHYETRQSGHGERFSPIYSHLTAGMIEHAPQRVKN